MWSRLLSLFRTEPALFTNAAQAAIGIIAAFGISFTAGQSAAVLAVTAALLAAVTAAYARPVTPSAFTGLVTAAGVLVAAYGVHFPADLVGGVNLLIATVFAMLTRANVTPVVTLKKMAAAAELVPLTASVGQVPVDTTDLARKIAAELGAQAKQAARTAASASFAGFAPAVPPDPGRM